MAKPHVLILNSRDHQRKKYSVFWLVIILMVIAFLSFVFFRRQQQISIQSLRLYYFDAQQQELIPVQRKLELSGTPEKAIKTMIEQLALPPEDKDLISLVPAFTKVKSVSFQNNLCTVTFQDPSVSELADSVVRESAAVYSLVNSITEFPGVDRVQLIIEGKNDVFFRRYFSIEQPLTRLTGQLMKGINTLLYFYHYPTESFTCEFREIPDKGDLSQASMDVVRQLILGPDQKELSSLIPQGTQVISSKVENGICFLNFSKEVRRFSLGANEELALINLITLSLTELQGIERVRYLIEGKEVYTLGGHIAVEKAIHRWYGTFTPTTRLYFLRKFQQSTTFVPIERKIESQQAEKIVEAMLQGTTAQEKETGITTDIPSGINIIACYPNESNELIVDLDVELSKFLNAQQEQNFIRQMVLSVTENTSIKHIRFYFDGKKLESLPFGTDISKAFSRKDSFR